MSEIITKLYEIDEEACKIIENTKLEKRNMEEHQSKEFERITNRYKLDLERKLAHRYKELEQRNNQQLEEIESINQEALRDLEDAYKYHTEQLAEEIFIKMIEKE